MTLTRRNESRWLVATGLPLLLLAGCATEPRLLEHATTDQALIPGEETLEIGLDASGEILEVEYHTTWDRLPDAVRRAAEREMPGGTVRSCEKEYAGGRIYWEVEKESGGMKIEVMFTPDGAVFSTETQIPDSGAPRAVLEAAERAVPGAPTSVEEVKEGGRTTYHVKKVSEGIRYKLIFASDGKLKRALREIKAEIEVPIEIGREMRG